MRPAGRARAALAAAAVLTAAAVSGCGTAKPIYRGDPEPPARRPLAAAPGSLSPAGVKSAAEPWLGTPYVYGGDSRRGIDCSALVQNVLGDLGATLPRTVRDQRMQGKPVPAADLASGDLVFFRLGSSEVNHVGVMLDRTRFVHASSSRGVVIDHLMERAFARGFAGGRRVLE